MSVPAFADASQSTIPLFIANYQADIKGFRVNATRELLNRGDGQQALVFKADSMIASLKEMAQFKWVDGQIKPLRYDYSQNVMGRKEVRSVEFNHKAPAITAKYKGKDHNISYSSLVLDSLSHQLQLQQDLLDGKEKFNYSVIRRNKIKPMQFKREGEETITTAIGQIKTIKVSLTHNTDRRKTHVWFAVDWDYLLVRLEQYKEDKKELVITLTDATIAGIPVNGF